MFSLNPGLMHVRTGIPDLPGFSQGAGRRPMLCGLWWELIGWRVSRPSCSQSLIKTQITR